MIATILCARQRCHPATVVSAAANRPTAALRYDWNAQMSASFLFSLQVLGIRVRNAVINASKASGRVRPIRTAGAGKRLGQIDSPVGPLGFRGLAAAAFTGKLFTNATASSSHALSAPFIGTGGSI